MTDLSSNPAIRAAQKSTITIGRLSMSDMWGAVTNTGMSMYNYFGAPSGAAPELTMSEARHQFAKANKCHCSNAMCDHCKIRFTDIYPDGR